VTWAAVAATAAGTYLMKAAGPVFLGGRTLPRRLQDAFVLVAVALLAALVAVSTFVSGTHLTLDARAAGIAAAAVAAARRAPFVVTILVAAAVAAVARLLGAP
jgi:uncharacterized membrane protein